MGTLRYVYSSNGLKVRDAAAGNFVTSLNFGDVMYDIGTTTIQRTLNGTVYNWRYVYYYKGHNTLEEGYGWIAEEFTTEVPAAIPSVSETISNDTYLPTYQQLINARYIFQYFRSRGWTVNSIYAMLGNMETESSINPGKWQYPNDLLHGYGLTQWDDAIKLIDWVHSEYSDTANPGYIDYQLKRIEEEVDGTIAQWDYSKHSPTMTFSAFTKSTASVNVLAEYFLRCYEQPEDIDDTIETRKKNANKWSTLLDIIDY